MIMNPARLALQVGVKGIAEKTGGDFIRADDASASFQEAMRRIRTRYSLYYALPEGKPGTPHGIRVELTQAAAKLHPKSRVRARTGYIPNSRSLWRRRECPRRKNLHQGVDRAHPRRFEAAISGSCFRM